MKDSVKISGRQAKILAILFISVLMTVVMSGGMLLFRYGLHRDFMHRWLSDFILGCCIAIPAGYVFVPLVEKIMARMTE
jgi:Protein of unknown function (DUF2798)